MTIAKGTAGNHTKGIERKTSWSYKNKKGVDENHGEIA